MNTPRKETLYKTAYYPAYKCHVELVHAHQDDRGGWIFTGRFTDPEDGRFYDHLLFRTCELENFVL